MNSRAVSSLTRALGRAAVKIILQEIISSPSPFLQGLPVSRLFSRIILSSTCKLRLPTATFPEVLSVRQEAWPFQVSHGAK